MNELQQILNAVDSADGPLFLATVVDVDGSAYRRPGARMLVLPDGGRVGTISGGCLERDLCRQAAIICKDGQKLISFDTRNESTDLNRRYNLGCSGIIYVLVEPITGDDRCPLRHVRAVHKTLEPRVIGTVYKSSGSRLSQWQVGERFVDVDLRPFALPADPETFEQLSQLFAQTRATGRPICCQIIGSGDQAEQSGALVFIELLSPPKPFWIFGAGDDAIPLAMIAGEVGWSVSVIDDRPSNLTKARFPTADRLVLDAVEEARSQLMATPQTAAVVMTHSFTKDARIIPWLCETQLDYIGLLGPKSRTAKLFKQIHAAGKLPPPAQLDKLHTPVGLDIGASDPRQVAVSIVAEVIAVEHGRCGRPLAERREPICDPVAHGVIDLGKLAANQPFA